MNKRLVALLSVALVVMTAFSVASAASYVPVATVANLMDQSKPAGPDLVQFYLLRAHQQFPDFQMLSDGWKFYAWNSSGIYYYGETHNGMTNCYMNFLQYQVASTAKNSTGLGYIALSTNATAPTTTDQKTNCWMQGEIAANGLNRKAGSVTLNSTALSALVVTFKVTTVFTATGTQTNIYEAGLAYQGIAACSATYPTNKCFIAITALPVTPINMGAADVLTIVWASQWTGT